MAYFDSGCDGNTRIDGLRPWEWTDKQFKQRTGCAAFPMVINNQGVNSNVLGQQTTNAQNGPDCEKWTGYFSKYINGVYYGTLQPLTLRALYSYSKPRCGIYGTNTLDLKKKAEWDYPRLFCENLYHPNGQIVPASERPWPCGGAGPDFNEYDYRIAGLKKAQPHIDDLRAHYATEDRTRLIMRIALLVAVLIIVLSIIKRM